MIKIGMASLGCPKNQVDAEMMLWKLRESGYEITPDEREAEIIIVNTCGFIEAAKNEGIETILEIARLKNDGKLKSLIVTGCLAERYRDQIREQIPEVDVVVSLGKNGDIVEIVKEAERGFNGEEFSCNEAMPIRGGRVLINEPWYAYLKIAEGCNNRCSYCAIPLIRGKMRSRPVEELVAEAAELAERGVRELVVVAQDTTRYGEDLYGKCELPRLLRELCKIEKLHWIRFLYSYPERITDELLEVMAGEEKIVKYLDIPIQHCNGDILKRMHRPGDRKALSDIIAKIRATVPDVVLRTTLITGFPGETEEQFNELCKFVKEMKFDRLGCFAYSPEEDTPAAEYPDQIEDEVKIQRQDTLMEQQSFLAEQLCADRVDSEIEVLAEGYDTYIKHYFGRSAADAPDIDCKVFFTAEAPVKPGEFVRVRVTDTLDLDLLGERI